MKGSHNPGFSSDEHNVQHGRANVVSQQPPGATGETGSGLSPIAKILIIVGIIALVVILLVVIIVLAVVLTQDNKKKDKCGEC